jgi:prepilin-type N-terminal cleavage/methylation domain-containing protein
MSRKNCQEVLYDGKERRVLSMKNDSRSPRGFTVLEVLMVIAVIVLLMAVLFMAMSKMRERTRMAQAKNMLEKMHAAMEAYYLHFRAYPPDNFGGRSGSQSINYFMTTAFRTTPALPKGEVLSSMDVGPMMSFEERELDNPTTAGTKTIVDPWRTPIVYRLQMKDFPDPQTGVITKIPIPVLYSCGTNKIDETISAATPTDDIIVGNQ